MSRTTQYKIGYLVTVCAVAAVAVLLTRSIGRDLLTAAIIVALILLIPGRVQGFLYRELFQGRVLLEEHRELEAIKYFQRFLIDVRARPWLKPMIWLSWSVYTPSVEAMALNNIGVANLALGQLDESESAFRQALTLDESYPLPHFNMAVLHEMRGDREHAEEALVEAARLGYTGGTVNSIVNGAQSLLARVEGRGVKAV